MKTIHSYQIIKKIGEGGLGEVFQVKNMKNQKTFALKKIHEIYQRENRILGLFHKEMMIHSRISHKNCVTFVEANFRPPFAYIITSYVNGFTFYDLMMKPSSLPPPLISICLIFELLRGLEHLHCLDIIHADLSPKNVMLSLDGRVKLVDFGLSAIQEIENYAGLRIGTPGYMAPERLFGDPISIQTDLYCVSLILAELLSGKRLIQGTNQYEQMKNLPLNLIRFTDQKFSKKILKILEKGLSLDPNKRYDSSRHFMFDLYHSLKDYNIQYLRQATLQWMGDQGFISKSKKNPSQSIYLKSA